MARSSITAKITTNTDIGFYPFVGDRNLPVDPNSVVQLVGYDADGREVYEGDIVIDKFGIS